MRQEPFFSQHIATRALHGARHFENELSHSIRSQLLSSIHLEGGGHASNIFGLEEIKYSALRQASPECTLLEQCLSSLDGGRAAQLLSSGNSAIFQTVLNICRSGDEFLSSTNLYGSTQFTFSDVLPRFNIKARYADMDDVAAVRRAIGPATRLIFLETVSLPDLCVRDIESIAAVAAEHHLPLVVDSSFTPPSLLRPLEHGAHIVVHSLNMWYNGHAPTPGGVVVDGATFDWTDPKFDNYNEPDNHYLGLRFAHDLGNFNSLAFLLRLRTVGMSTMASPLAPALASQMYEAVKTLELRTVRQSENALATAQFLGEQARVDQVRYPGFDAARASQYLPKGAGGMVSFRLKGGVEACQQFLSRLKIFNTHGSIGNVRSLALYPATPQHHNTAKAEIYSHEFDTSMLCLSLGIEAIDDILADLRQALKKLH